MKILVASFYTSFLLVSGCGARNALPIGDAETSSSSANAAGGGSSVTSTTSGVGGGQPPVCTDVAETFSGVDNPNGSWSYGWWSMAPPAGSFTLYDVPDLFDGLEEWHSSILVSEPPGYPPSVYFNGTNVVQFPGTTVTIQPGQFAMHPGPLGEHSVVRWVAPTDGMYSIAAKFTGISHADPTTTDVHVLIGSSAVFSGSININGGGSTSSYNDMVALNSGQAVYFSVGFGNGTYFYDSTALAASICSTSGG